jgi:uncharacterized iron-regulated membrane protein
MHFPGTRHQKPSSNRMLRGKTRSLLRQFHLWAGLCFGTLFALSGLTGSAIVWLHELDNMLNPDLFQVAPASGVIPDASASITPARVQQAFERLAADPRYGRPTQITLSAQANETLVAWYRSGPSTQASPLALQTSRQVMLNPDTLQIAGERNWGNIGMSRRLLMPTLFHLHRYLLAGEIGKTAIGISALVLVITSSAGALLWWPKRQRKALRQAFTISRGGSWPRFFHSSHRVAGFFAAPVLIMLGFSGWYFNLPKWVTPIVSSVATVSASPRQINRMPVSGAPLSPGQAMQAAQALFPNARISRIALPATPSVPYEIRLRQPGEIRQGDGATRITIDAYTGNILQVRDPLQAPGGDIFLNWLFPLHSGEAFGNAGRIFISAFGFLPLLFLLTGLAVWIKRKKKSTRANDNSSHFR